MEYKIVLESFEGPMDLLLHLIDKAEIDIYDIPINEITEQYLGYIEKMESLDLDITSEFLVMAATLLEIKSKMLLPVETSNDSSEDENVDPRSQLVKQLIEYKKFKHASRELKNYRAIQEKVFFKPQEDLTIFHSDTEELEEMDLQKLTDVLNKLLKKNKNINTPIDINKIPREEYSLEKSMEEIKLKLEKTNTIKFNDLFKEKATREEIVITFLSILELIKAKYISIYQEENFSEIIINKRGVEHA